jgi:16S rRNA (guanine527-N7)-methyltransferase
MPPRDIDSLVRARASSAGLEISDELARRLTQYYVLLERWNQTINLTSLIDTGAAVDRLLLEPVAAARHLPSGGRLMDIGSGGGSPALPLAMTLSASSLLMVESKGRKAAFLREAVRELGLPRAAVESSRFEDLIARQDLQGKVSVVSIRAVRLDAAILTDARRFLAPDGFIALFRGMTGPDAIDAPHGLRWVRTHPLLEATRSRLSLLRVAG